MNRWKWRNRPTFLDSDWKTDLLRKFRVKSAGQIPPEVAKQGTVFDQVQAVSASACMCCIHFCMIAGSSLRNAILMNECCWIGILKQFLHCISVGGSKWIIEAERHNSSISLPHKMQILKLYVGRKKEGIHDSSCSSFCASQGPAGMTSSQIIYLLNSWLVPGEALPCPYFIMKQYHKIIPKLV